MISDRDPDKTPENSAEQSSSVVAANPADSEAAEPNPFATLENAAALTQERLIDALKTIYDPEIPVNIYDLGLIYDVSIRDDGEVDIMMTLTTPGCPVAHTFPSMVEGTLLAVEGVNACHVEIVWDPPWSQDMMSEAARLQLGLL